MMKVCWIPLCLLFGCGGIVDVAPDDTADAAKAHDSGVSEQPVLAELRLSVPGALSPDFAPDVTVYHVDVSILAQYVSVTAVAIHGDAVITVNNTVVTPGEPSPPIPLSLGANELIVDVNTPSMDGLRYIFTIERGADIAQGAYAKMSNPGSYDFSGYSVALWGDTLAVSAPAEDSGAIGIDGDQDNEIVADSGAVYVFRRMGSIWAQEAYIKAFNTGTEDQFGRSVTLGEDTLVVGAPYEDSDATGVDGDQANENAANSGAAYVFHRTGSVWKKAAYLKASNSSTQDHFGWSVALSGEVLAVGAPGEDSIATDVDGNQASDDASESGAVYIFRRTDMTWAQEAYVKASNTEAQDLFGSIVALSGETLAVGAPGEDSNATGADGDQVSDDASESGAVYIFRRTDMTWAQEAYVKASNTEPFDRFGAMVALSGEALAVGAPGEDSNATGADGDQANNSASESGAVYIFRRVSATWVPEAYLKASNAGVEDKLGSSIALLGDVLATGAPNEASFATGVGGDQSNDNAAYSGAIYVFRRASAGWGQEAYLKASNAGGADYFGSSVALSDSGLAVGAFGEDSGSVGIDGNQNDDGTRDSGAAYVFY